MGRGCVRKKDIYTYVHRERERGRFENAVSRGECEKILSQLIMGYSMIAVRKVCKFGEVSKNFVLLQYCPSILTNLHMN